MYILDKDSPDRRHSPKQNKIKADKIFRTNLYTISSKVVRARTGVWESDRKLLISCCRSVLSRQSVTSDNTTAVWFVYIPLVQDN